MEEWIHLQHDVYPPYITWDDYLANQARLHDNETIKKWGQCSQLVSVSFTNWFLRFYRLANQTL